MQKLSELYNTVWSTISEWTIQIAEIDDDDDDDDDAELNRHTFAAGYLEFPVIQLLLLGPMSRASSRVGSGIWGQLRSSTRNHLLFMKGP